MTKTDIDTIIKIICPNDEDFEKPIISPAYLKKELEVLALDQESCNTFKLDGMLEDAYEHGYQQARHDYEAPLCEDAIDRRALRAQFNHLDEVYEGMSEEERREAYIYELIIGAIDAAPPVTPKLTECEDVISREAMLDGLASIAKAKAKSDAQKALMGRVMFFTEQLPPVTSKPTECEDAVSRDSALNALCYACSIHQNGGKCSRCEGYNAISDLPSVIPAIPVCEDAVNREAVLDALHVEGRPTKRFEYVIEVRRDIEALPFVTPRQKIGKWIEERNDYGEIQRWHCSECYEDTGFTTNCKWDFCPSCGAKMEGVRQ